MDVSNGTGEGTDYRTGSGTTKVWRPWSHLPDKSPHHCPDPQDLPWTICFRLKGKTVATATYDYPVQSVTLVKRGSGYKINAVKKVEKQPKPTTKPQAKKPSKAA